MRVDKDALAAIRVKVERSYAHFLTLGAEFQPWLDRNPYEIRREVHSEGAEHLLRVRFTEPIPPTWSVILGEAVHDLRSALDQTIYWLSIDYSGVELLDTQFPIFTTRLGVASRGPGKPHRVGFAQTSPKFPEGIPGSGLRMLRGVGPGPRALIAAIQPYPQRNGPLPKSLLSLHDFWNQDKHRLSHLWGLVMVGNRELSLSGSHPPSSLVGVPWLNSGVMKSGAIILKATIDPPNPDVVMDLKTDVAVAVKHPRRAARRSAKVTVMDMFFDCAAVCARLMLAFGKQDEPVSMDALPRSEWGFLGD